MHVFWIDASNKETITQSFLSIATAERQGGNTQIEASIESSLQWISTLPPDWLIIFDNADGAPDEILQVLAPGNRGNVIITSRNPDMQRIVPPGAALNVEDMEEEEAISLLLKSARINSSSDDLKR